MTQKHLHTPLDGFERFTDFQIETAARYGELALDFAIDLPTGRWQAFYLGPDTLDSLVGRGVAPEDATEQLLLVHESEPIPEGTALPPLAPTATMSIDGARFLLADSSMKDILETDDGFYDHLDGVHGALENRRGVQVLMDGDGRARLWLNERATLVLIELA